MQVLLYQKAGAVSFNPTAWTKLACLSDAADLPCDTRYAIETVSLYVSSQLCALLNIDVLGIALVLCYVTITLCRVPTRWAPFTNNRRYYVKLLTVVTVSLDSWMYRSKRNAKLRTSTLERDFLQKRKKEGRWDWKILGRLSKGYGRNKSKLLYILYYVERKPIIFVLITARLFSISSAFDGNYRSVPLPAAVAAVFSIKCTTHLIQFISEVITEPEWRSGLQPESAIFAGAGPGVRIMNKNRSRSRSGFFSFYRSRIIALNKF